MNDLNGDISTNLYYDFTDHDKLSANFRYYHYGKDEHQVGDTRVGGGNAPQIRLTDNRQIVKQAMNFLNTSINFRHDFGASHQHSLLLLGDISKSFYTSKYNFKYNNFDEALEPVSEERVKHRELLPFFIVSTEARVTWQLTPKAQLMAGTKYSYSSKTNDFRSFSLNGGQWQEDEGYGYDLTYAENLQATYLKYSLDLEHWSLTAGLRGEYDASNAQGYALLPPLRPLPEPLRLVEADGEKHAIAESHQAHPARELYQADALTLLLLALCHHGGQSRAPSEL